MKLFFITIITDVYNVDKKELHVLFTKVDDIFTDVAKQTFGTFKNRKVNLLLMGITINSGLHLNVLKFENSFVKYRDFIKIFGVRIA